MFQHREKIAPRSRNRIIKLSGRCDGIAVLPLWDGARDAAKLCSVCPVEFAEGAGEAEQCQQAQAGCMLVLLGKKPSKPDFLAPQGPTSSSALTGFFPCIEYELSHPVHVPEECQFDPLASSLLDVCDVVA